MIDIVERLRGGVFGIDRIPLCAEAADEIARLRDENAKLRAERDDADRRAGAAEREQEHDREAAYARDSWLRRAKEQWGVGPAISFDVVWGEALELKKDAERLDWLEQIAGRFANIDRITSVGSKFNGMTSLRAAIDAAMQKGEYWCL